MLDSTGGPGIVSFITASSYLRGPGFAGMRKVMRQTFDRIWILDLEGDTLGSRKTDNVFATKTPVAIAIGVRYGVPRETTPALVRYARVQGTRPEKLRALKSIRQFDDVQWQACGSEWLGPFSPRTTGRYFDWPPLTDLFPWQHSGVQFKRAWPIAPSREQLQKRWKRFLDHPPDERAKIFRETPDRKIGKSYTDLGGSTRLPPLREIDRGTRPPPMLRYAFRSFDRQWALLDNRLADRPRPALWRLHSNEQLYLTSMLSGAVGPGPGATVAADVPDLHHFRGSYGGADVVPLWRDSATSHPNVTRGLLGLLSERIGLQVSAKALFAYCYGILTSPSYFRLFAEELTASGPRIPLTTDTNLFLATVSLGRHLVWLHTYGERWKPSGASGQAIPQGSARCRRHISTRRYPYTFSYDQERRALVIDEGEFSPVIPEVWDYCVSGLKIVDSWLGYRMAFPTGRRSSILDDIHPDHWTATLNEELLQLLWLLEGTIQLRSTLEDNLDRILSSNLMAAGDLPRPAAGERRPPPRSSTAFQAAMLSDDSPGPADWPA